MSTEKRERRHPGLDRVGRLEAEETGADPLLEDEDEQTVGRADREQVQQDSLVPATTIERKTTVRKTNVSRSTSAITQGAGSITESK